MIIAIDFDSTYDTDPDFWDGFIFEALGKGKDVILATYRHEEYDAHPLLDHLRNNVGIQLYFTDGMAKRPFLEHQGVHVNIWIDDNPRSITDNSAWAPDSPELHAWRMEQQAKLEDSTLKVA